MTHRFYCYCSPSLFVICGRCFSCKLTKQPSYDHTLNPFADEDETMVVESSVQNESIESLNTSAIFESLNESMSESLNESVTESINESMGYSGNDSLIKTVDESTVSHASGYYACVCVFMY